MSEIKQSIDKERATNQFELEKQLHEQYAINSNAGTRSLIAFITAIVALFWAFGAVSARTTPNFAKSNESVFSCDTYSIEAYIGIAVVASLMLCFLADIALCLGATQRHTHWVIQRIRERHYSKEEYSIIFGDGWKATGKSSCEFIPGMYNIFFWMFVWLQVLILACTICQFIKLNEWQWVWTVLLLQMILIFTSLWRRCCHYYCKYQKYSGSM